MSARCCSKPNTRIILIGGIETGIIGLDDIFKDVYMMNIKEEEQIKNLLLYMVKEYGNYVSQKREIAYKEDLFREFKMFCESIEQEKRK